MLTWTDLENLRHGGKLVKWLPSGLTEVPTEGRALYMVSAVHTAFTTGNWFAPSYELPVKTRERKAALRAVLTRYVRGSHLNVNRDIKELGTKSSNATMRGYWEFRSHPPQEETRLFGFFARPGAFVATDFQPRGKFVTQAHWLAQRQACQLTWDSLTNKAVYMTSPWPVQTTNDLGAYI
jgi:hypothetical protein